MPEMKELGVVRVASPCRQQWSRMIGDERRRFCAACKLNVYDLSALTSDQARALVKNAEGRLCVRFWSRADGTVITRDCPIGARWKTWKWSAAAIAAVNLFAAAVHALFSSEPPQVAQKPRVVSPVEARTGMLSFRQNTEY